MRQADWKVPHYELFNFHKKRNPYCLCIPVINEGEKFIKQLKKLIKYNSVIDILVLDGGSTDGSIDPEKLKLLNIRALLIKKDTGKLSAQLRMGYAFVLKEGYKGVITIDGNGKDDVRAIPHFIEALEQGFDYVQGSRFIKGGKAINTPLLRYLAIRLVHAPVLSLSARRWLTDTTNGFRAYSSRYLFHKDVQPFRNVFDRYELLAYLSVRASQVGLRVKEIPVTRIYPQGKVPTKISSLSGYLDLIKTLIFTLVGKFKPLG